MATAVLERVLGLLETGRFTGTSFCLLLAACEIVRSVDRLTTRLVQLRARLENERAEAVSMRGRMLDRVEIVNLRLQRRVIRLLRRRPEIDGRRMNQLGIDSGCIRRRIENALVARRILDATHRRTEAIEHEIESIEHTCNLEIEEAEELIRTATERTETN